MHSPRTLVLAALLAFFALSSPPAPAGAATPGPAAGSEADAAESSEAAAPAEQAVAEELPDARALLARFRELGGYAKLKATKNQHVVGSFSLPAQGLEATMEAWVAAPNLSRVVIELPGMGTTQEGFDGTHGWSLDPIQGPVLKTGAVLEEAAFKAEYYALNDDTRYVEAETVERTEFAGRSAWKVRLKPRVGSDMFVYFDAETGFEIGEEETVSTAMGDIPLVITNHDYAEFHGMQFPTRVEQKMMGMTQIIRLESIEFDVGEPPDFTPPKEVLELLEDAASESEPTEADAPESDASE